MSRLQDHKFNLTKKVLNPLKINGNVVQNLLCIGLVLSDAGEDTGNGDTRLICFFHSPVRCLKIAVSIFLAHGSITRHIVCLPSHLAVMGLPVN